MLIGGLTPGTERNADDLDFAADATSPGSSPGTLTFSGDYTGESARVTVFLEEDSIFESVVLDRHTISGSGLLELLLVLGVISGEIEIASVSTSPGSSPGTLTFSGDYNLDTNAVQTLEIGGLTPGTEHDHLIFNDSLTLGGTLDIR